MPIPSTAAPAPPPSARSVAASPLPTGTWRGDYGAPLPSAPLLPCRRGAVRGPARAPGDLSLEGRGGARIWCPAAFTASAVGRTCWCLLRARVAVSVPRAADVGWRKRRRHGGAGSCRGRGELAHHLSRRASLEECPRTPARARLRYRDKGFIRLPELVLIVCPPLTTDPWRTRTWRSDQWTGRQ